MKKSINLLLIFLILISCEKDNISESPNVNNQLESLTDEEFRQNNFGDIISANFIGQIVDDEGNKLKDVQVSIGNQNTFTDLNGVFILNNALVYENFAFIKASKNNYILGSRTLVPALNGVNDVRITLLEKQIVDRVNSGVNSEIVMPNGSKVEFQGNFIDSNGNDYNGEVDVSLHYLKPNQESTFIKMPGMLFGMRENGLASAMETYGMLSVNLFSPNGEQLNIAETFPAIIKIPVDASTPNAPETIALWYFDEIVGYWKEQGIASKVGNEYIAEVTHFTWWNYDIPINYVNICFTLSSQSPLPDFNIEIVRNETGQIIFYGNTNNVGQECGLFPENEEVTLNVYGECSESIIYTQVLGPFSSDTTLNVFIPDLPSEIIETTLTGTVADCSGELLTNGYALLFNSNSVNFSDYEIISITDGIFNHQYTFCDGETYKLIIYDLENSQVSEITDIILNPTITNLGNLQVCGNAIGGTYTGNITLLTQQEVNLFGLLGYDTIIGNLVIDQSDEISDIFNLSSLHNITTINGSLFIVKADVLSSLNGLENLVSVSNSFYISNCPLLISISSLLSLTSVGDLTILNNDLLTNLEGLESITALEGNMEISNNDSLITLDGLSNITSIDGYLKLNNNTSLSSLSNFVNLTSIGSYLRISLCSSLVDLSGLQNTTIQTYLWITQNELLSSLTGLEGITTIDDFVNINSNNSLITLNGINNLTSVNNISIGNSNATTVFPNPNLTNLCALQNLFTNGTYSMVTIEHNAYNPSVEEIINGNCSL